MSTIKNQDSTRETRAALPQGSPQATTARRAEKDADAALLSPLALMALGLAGVASAASLGEPTDGAAPPAPDATPGGTDHASSVDLVADAPIGDTSATLEPQLNALVLAMLGESATDQSLAFDQAAKTLTSAPVDDFASGGAGAVATADASTGAAAVAAAGAAIDAAPAAGASVDAGEAVLLAQATTGTNTAPAAPPPDSGSGGMSSGQIFAGVAALAVAVAAGSSGRGGAQTPPDTTPPVAPTITLATDSGNAADKITNVGTVNVAGLETGATWQFSTNAGQTWTAGTGTSFTLSGDGAKSVTVRQTDAAGNVGPASNALAFTLDTSEAAPSATLASNTGNPADSITSIGTVNVGGLEAGATWQFSTTGGETWVAGVGTSFTLTGDGAKSVQVRQTDVAGNTSAASGALAFTLDSAAPLLQSFA